MKNFSVGLALGLLIGAAVPATAAAIVGNTGYMFGWTVTKGGIEVCGSPFVWVYSREIACD